MAEMTLEQQKAIALANARMRAAGAGAQPEQSKGALDYLKTAADLANRANPAGFIASSISDNLIKDATSQPKVDARDSTLGKADSFVRGMADTLSFGTADELAAAADAALNPVLGTGQDAESFGDRYAKNVAIERATDKADAANRFQQRLAGQLTGGVTQGAGLIRAGLSPTAAAIEAGKSLPKVMGYGAVEGGTLSALQGLGSGEDLQDRIKKAAIGAGVGGFLGGVTPLAVSAAKGLYDRATAAFSPESARDRIMAALLRKSGMTADDLERSLQGAQDDAQGMFTTADALELPGQRILSTTVRTPNDARKAVADALKSRQMDQGRRVAADLEDASGSMLTADQYRQLLSSRRAEDASRNYAPVMEDMNPINVTPAVSEANRRISPVAEMRANIRGDVPTDIAARAPIEDAEAAIRDPIRQALKEARSYLAADNLTVTNVEKAFRAKTNIDQMIDKATENGQGATVNALIPVRDALDNALASTSPQYASARDAYRAQSGVIDAIDVGREMARPRRRVADNLATFGALPDDASQQAARVGYFDPKIAAAETNTGTMTNSARPFVSEAMRQELPAFSAPGQGDLLMRRLGRENTMSETANLALGGSKTADNTADMIDTGIDPGVAAALLQGRFKDAAWSALAQTGAMAKGMPPSVIERLAPVLMETNPAMARQLFSESAQAMNLSDQARARVVAALLASGGSAIPRMAAP